MNPAITEHRYRDDAQLAGALADWLADRLRAAITERGQALLCVSGGRSPIPLFEALARRPLDWSRVSVTLVDERCVPLSHADSNTGLLKRHLLTGAAAAARLIELVPADLAVDADPAPLAKAAEQALRPVWPADVVVLGMGLDGHTASLFPGVANFAAITDPASAQLCVPVLPLNAPHPRVSLSLAALLSSRQLVLQIAGADKLRVFGQALAAVSADQPISLVLAQTGTPVAVWIGEPCRRVAESDRLDPYALR